ncbi:hypothetical protein F5Y11DRAFT_306744 [Daldinia sp. FL1419]|nr:hypothetical protein F5Y11DRAFT_306744 [Daldinia sp. FL1419]
MTFGYDSIVIRSFRKNKGHNILHHANELIASLHRERANDPKRPLVFIAHSLGGIVVKIMLKTSDDQPTYQDLIKSTGGVIFLGTPHRGSTAADRGLLVANLARFAFLKSNDRILRALRAESDILESYRDSFNHLLHKVQLHVYSFYETERMLNIPGINSMIVPYESAVIGDILYETRQSTQKNHSEICKFAEVEDDVYKSVSFAIKECLIRKQGRLFFSSSLNLPIGGYADKVWH